jgi:hypothetical protein
LACIDSEAEMARILAAELEDSLGFPVLSLSPEATPPPDYTLVYNEGQHLCLEERLRDALKFALSLRSMPEILAGLARPPIPILVGIVTSSRTFRLWAETLLAALGFGPESVCFRDPREPGWQAGLDACYIVGADLVASRALHLRTQVRVVRLLRPESVTMLRQALGYVA